MYVLSCGGEHPRGCIFTSAVYNCRSSVGLYWYVNDTTALEGLWN
eukprot:COSAG02_NODE_1239_length_13713_cov_37.434259_5_plen_45_part_00